MIFKNVELYNVKELIEPEEGLGKRLSRLPNDVRAKINDFAQSMALFGSSCEIRFNMKGDTAKLVLKRDSFPPYEGAGVAEIYFGSFSASSHYSPIFIKTEPTEIIIKKPENISTLKELTIKNSLPYDPDLVRLILPYDSQNRLISIDGDLTPTLKGQIPNRKYLAYGSSITHGANALNPSGTYTAKIAYNIGADHINLGLAGAAQLEPEMADYIAERANWDIATLELGINVVGHFSVEEFANRVDYFISKITNTNKNKWIFCIDIFTFASHLIDKDKANEFRKIVRGKVESLNLPKLVYVNGIDLLTQTDGLSYDQIHPSATGMEEISTKLTKIIKKYTGF